MTSYSCWNSWICVFNRANFPSCKSFFRKPGFDALISENEQLEMKVKGRPSSCLGSSWWPQEAAVLIILFSEGVFNKKGEYSFCRVWWLESRERQSAGLGMEDQVSTEGLVLSVPTISFMCTTCLEIPSSMSSNTKKCLPPKSSQMLKLWQMPVPVRSVRSLLLCISGFWHGKWKGWHQDHTERQWRTKN